MSSMVLYVDGCMSGLAASVVGVVGKEFFEALASFVCDMQACRSLCSRGATGSMRVGRAMEERLVHAMACRRDMRSYSLFYGC